MGIVRAFPWAFAYYCSNPEGPANWRLHSPNFFRSKFEELCRSGTACEIFRVDIKRKVDIALSFQHKLQSRSPSMPVRRLRVGIALEKSN
jgi:hypothetical protein